MIFRKRPLSPGEEDALFIIGVTVFGLGSVGAIAAYVNYLDKNGKIKPTKVEISYADNTENSHVSTAEIVNDDYEPAVEYKVFNEGEHTIAKVTTKDNIKDVDGYSMIDISIIEDDKVIVTYVNAVPVNCMGIDGEYNTFGTIEENNKQKTK